ncbi:hypothetical protein C8R43DRAFT_1171322 [Mycena crocata]|nr:hypothetical protein C8R43DRAFT_1171322 [Mycena crocata]
MSVDVLVASGLSCALLLLLQRLQSQSSPTTIDCFYGYEYIALLSARFITHLFTCPPFPPKVNHWRANLPYFIAYALHRTKLHQTVTYGALVLLQRLKARFPTAKCSSGHRLFISAFMVASKIICDDSYSNKSWSLVAQGMFTLSQINQMEREMCNYLDWELTVDNPILGKFEAMVQRDFPPNSRGPYPTYSLHMVSKRVAKAAASTSATAIPEPNFTVGPIPGFGWQQCQVTSTKAKSMSLVTPDTPPHSYFDTTSPASSISPPTPPGPVDLTARISNDNSYEISPNLAITTEGSLTRSLKSKMFAFAIPAIW